MSAMALPSSPADPSPMRGPRPAEWALSALIVVLQFVAPRTGAVEAESLPVWAGVLVLLMAVGQGLAVALARRRPFAAATLVLTCYAVQALVAGAVPPFAAWVVIWAVGSRRASDAASVRLPIAVAAGTSAVVVAAELTHTGSSASALLVMITVVITLAAVLLRSERARIEAVRRRGGAEERLRIARDLHDLV